MKVGDLVEDLEGQVGIVMTNPRRSVDCDDAEFDIYDVVYAFMPCGMELFATDELEVISEGG